MSTEELVKASLDIQVECAAADSLGLCLFGRSVTNERKDFIAESLNNAHGPDLSPEFMTALGREALAMEWEFNKQAGFTEEDDELPEFFYTEELYPTNKTARHHTGPVNAEFRKLMAGFFKEEVSPHLESTTERLESIRPLLKEISKERVEHYESRLRKLENWHKMGGGLIDKITSFIKF